MCGSPVFEKMFDSSIEYRFVQEYMEFNGKKLPVVKVPDIEPSVLMLLFHYLYDEKVDLDQGNVIDALYTGSFN